MFYYGLTARSRRDHWVINLDEIPPILGYNQTLELEGFEPTLPADYLWFTQRVSYKDPCEEFKAVFKKMTQNQIKANQIKQKE